MAVTINYLNVVARRGYVKMNNIEMKTNNSGNMDYVQISVGNELYLSSRVSQQRSVRLSDAVKLLCQFLIFGLFLSFSTVTLRASSMSESAEVPCVLSLPESATASYSDECYVNRCFSPDSTHFAFTRNNNLYIADVADGKETQLTFDGSDLLLNGYASWVYYEEILGRASRYKAFWWSPDGRRIAFYRFDNSGVPYFPIYSPQGQSGNLNNTRYPKAGQANPVVRIGFVDIQNPQEIVWADFPDMADGYFGIPFWASDSRSFYVATLPRIQNELLLYSVDSESGAKREVYKESYSTWLDWFENVVFTDSGLYVARRFETGWDQIYFLSYDGKTFRRLTDGKFWDARVIRVDEQRGRLYFTAKENGEPRHTLFSVSLDGKARQAYKTIHLTDKSLNVSNVSFASDGKSFTADLSNFETPTRKCRFDLDSKGLPLKTCSLSFGSEVIKDSTQEGFDKSAYALPQIIYMTTKDGFRLPAAITYPMDFDPSGAVKYPVSMEIYGGPDTPYVRDMWRAPNDRNQWFARNGIIRIVCDSRAAGHNGRAGEDMVYKDLTTWPVRDFCAWADYLSALPFVDSSHIGVEGFSFGGTMTAMLLMRASDKFCCGIAGGGVYDWRLYDTHYTERYMETPATNPEGYDRACVLNYVNDYPLDFDYNDNSPRKIMLRLTHGTGDDNVHFQNTLQLIDALQKAGKDFQLMIYPDGMHGYRGYQGEHSTECDHQFYLKYLKGETSTATNAK